jgi:hypothetical protein
LLKSDALATLSSFISIGATITLAASAVPEQGACRNKTAKTAKTKAKILFII